MTSCCKPPAQAGGVSSGFGGSVLVNENSQTEGKRLKPAKGTHADEPNPQLINRQPPLHKNWFICKRRGGGKCFGMLESWVSPPVTARMGQELPRGDWRSLGEQNPRPCPGHRLRPRVTRSPRARIHSLLLPRLPPPHRPSGRVEPQQNHTAPGVKVAQPSPLCLVTVSFVLAPPAFPMPFLEPSWKLRAARGSPAAAPPGWEAFLPLPALPLALHPSFSPVFCLLLQFPGSVFKQVQTRRELPRFDAIRHSLDFFQSRKSDLSPRHVSAPLVFQSCVFSKTMVEP